MGGNLLLGNYFCLYGDTLWNREDRDMFLELHFCDVSTVITGQWLFKSISPTLVLLYKLI